MTFEVTVDGNDRLTVDDSRENRLGGGGQGEVYRVEYKGRQLALKWYTARAILENDGFRENLRGNTRRESPDKCFVWPQHFVEDGKGGYGYLMDVIDTDRYTLFSNIYNGRKRVRNRQTGRKETVEVRMSSFGTELNAAINLANAFRSLHRQGLAYQDLNDGGFYIDTETGDLLVCDCDNIAPSGARDCSIVLGTYGYMAPELVDEPGRFMPNMDTDKHSLAVLLFMLFIGGKPFDGKLLSGEMVDVSTQSRFYGRNAVFVYHPSDKSNRPIAGHHVNVIEQWPEFPPAIQKLFTSCFVDGVTMPTRRPTENKWIQALNSMRAGLITCACGTVEDVLTDSNIKGGKYVCPRCKSKYGVLSMSNGDRYPLKRGKAVYAASIGATSVDAVMGYVVGKESNGRIMLGLRNDGNMDWTVSNDGRTHTINQGNGFPLDPGMIIEFGYKEKVGQDDFVRKGKGMVE